MAIIFILVAIAIVVTVGLVLNNRVEAVYYERFLDGLESGFRNWQINIDSNLEEMIEYLNDNSLFLFNIDEYKSYTIVSFTSGALDIVHSSDNLFISNKDRLLSEIMSSRNLITALNDNESGMFSSLTKMGSRSYYDYTRRVSLSDGDYILYFRYDREAWKPLTDSFSNAILMGVIIAVAISTILGFIMSQAITNPIKKLMNGANSIAQGNLDQVIEAKSDDEIGKLTMAFNKMARSLKENVEEITSEKNKQENILNYSKDGIIAFNMKGEVILSNPTAVSMLGDLFLDTDFDSFASYFGMDYTIKSIIDKGAMDNWDITSELKERALDISCAIFSDISSKPGGIIVVMHDVTEQQKLENMRREFVANVSHELRTPLTAIISYSETLMDDGANIDEDMAEKFIGVIHSEAVRMARLVRELLQLSRFDNSQVRWNFTDLDVASVVRVCVDRMQITAVDKRQRLGCYVFGDVPPIWGDRDRLQQVILNIVSNALKYTPEGGNISVYVSRMSDEVHIKVCDTGIGIPAEDIPRLCERFFRVDKARSRDMGGTGLGLSIAKEIIDGHQGRLTINSLFGKGTDVIVQLPINAG
ncbi:MAG: cell wall metabolism sensor histidine kinase WalK [Oscillospiraceae bacterium]|nr:cell wall metabolism sensor histidine kinase WalK [Oscillospiraceae bacterium]